jgi:tetratricopeptide (TPR) repeat protein
MKPMKLSQARLGLLALVALVATTSGCGYINSLRAKNELNKVAQNYKEKKFAEAERHAKRALELDPDNENAPIFIARTIHAQYRKGVDTPENVAKANEAIEAYKQIAAKDPNNDEAFTAVTVLLGSLNKPDEQTAWVQQRADNTAVSPSKRADALAFLASKDWECSNQVTDNKANQQDVTKPDGTVVIQYVKPKDAAEYDKAVRCMTGGLEKAEKAISYDNDNEKAWSQKYNLLLEAKKLAQMDENTGKAEQLAKQAEEALKRTQELYERKKAAQATPTPAAG